MDYSEKSARSEHGIYAPIVMVNTIANINCRSVTEILWFLMVSFIVFSFISFKIFVFSSVSRVDLLVSV